MKDKLIIFLPKFLYSGAGNSVFSLINFLNKEDFEAEIKNLREKEKTYRNERNDSINDLNKKRLDATNQLFKTLNPILAQYSNYKSISLIIQKKNIIIGKSELDITDTILTLLNKNIKDIKIK